MTSKRRASKPAENLPEEPPRNTAAAVPAAGWFDRILARLKTLKGAIVAIAGVGAVLGGLAGYWNAYQAARASTQSSQLLALVGKGDAGPLSIVVLPFANLTGDPQQAYVADGITAAVTADLSRIRDAFIVSAATAFAYKDKAVTVQQIGKELGVRFALQGGVQRSGDKIRINAQLADTTTNAQLWTESFDGNQADLFALQELITVRIGRSIGREMLIVAARESETRKSDPRAIDLMLRARAIGLKPESTTIYGEAQALYRQVLALEPKNAKAMVGLASWLSSEAFNYLPDSAIKEKQMAEARDLALKAKELAPNEPRIYVILSDYALLHGDQEAAVRFAETALSLDPKNPDQYFNLSSAYQFALEPSRARELLTQGIRLDPRNIDELVLFNVGVVHFNLGNDEAAIEWLLKTADNPGFPEPHFMLAMAYARKGDQARTRAAVAALLRLEPDFSMSKRRAKFAGFPAAYRKWWDATILQAGRLAGLPE